MAAPCKGLTTEALGSTAATRTEQPVPSRLRRALPRDPKGAHTHGSTSMFSGRPQAWAYSLSWNMGSVLKTLARSFPGTSTVGRHRGVGSCSQCQLPQLLGPAPSLGHFPPELGAGSGRVPLLHLQSWQRQVASSRFKSPM